MAEPLSGAYLAAVAEAERQLGDPAELNAFMTARLDEDQTAAEEATSGPWWDPDMTVTAGCHYWGIYADEDQEIEVAAVHVPMAAQTKQDEAYCNAVYIARHHPSRILAEIAVKREHLRMYVEQRATLTDVYANPDRYLHDQKIALVGAVAILVCVVRRDAAVYDQHPDFKQSWRLP